MDVLSWEDLPYAAYSVGLAPSDYYLFASVTHSLAEQRFGSYEDVKKRLDEWFAARGGDFYLRGIHKLCERREECITSDEANTLCSFKFNVIF